MEQKEYPFTNKGKNERIQTEFNERYWKIKGARNLNTFFPSVGSSFSL